MPKNLLFDLDGTLIDSSRCIYAVYTDLFNELNLPVPPEDIMRGFIGPPIEEIIGQYYDGDTAATARRFRELYKKVDLDENNRVYDGVYEMLGTLKNSGFSLHIATTKNALFANRILDIKNLTGYFDAIQGSCAAEGIIGKTDVLNAIFNTGVKKEDSLLIGDTGFDAQGAKRAGVRVAIVTYGFGDLSDFDGYDIEWFADSPAAVTDEIMQRYVKKINCN